jgi:lysophospholipase
MKYSATKEFLSKTEDDIQLPAYAWLPEGKIKAVFIAIHGGMAYAGDWESMAIYFKKKGIATYALDLRWHGHFSDLYPKEHTFFHIDSYDTYASDIHQFYLSVAEDNPDTPIFFLAHSNGALISLYYGLTLGKETKIAGLILSSPWLVNRVEISKPLEIAAKILSVLKPKFEVKPAALTEVLTHDAEITARHFRDEESGVRGVSASAKLSVESAKAQSFVLDHIDSWDNCPILGFIAGEDRLADPESSIAALKKISRQEVETVVYPENYHENFNEVNRDETFQKILHWVKNRL